MPRLTLPEDAVQISKYGKHELAGLYYSPSTRCLYNSYKIVRRVNVDGRNGFYTRMKGDADKVRTLYISLNKLFKEYAELADIIEWTRPERVKGAHLTKSKTAAETKDETPGNDSIEPPKGVDSNPKGVDSNPKGEEAAAADDKITIDISDGENDQEPKPKKKSKGPKHGIDYDSAFKAMRNATSQKMIR